MSPSLSIVATIYNKDLKSLQTFLEALKRQTSKDFELVLIDDCSTVSYRGLVNRYLKDVRITYVRFGKNKGQCHARNVGLQEAKGEILCIVDSDCIPNAEFVAGHLIEHRNSPVIDVLIGPYNIESNGRDIWQLLALLDRDQEKLKQEMSLQYPPNPGYYLNFITRNVSINRRVLPSGLFDESFGYQSTNPQSGFGWEDIEAGYRLFKYGLHFAFTHRAFTVHLSHPDTTDSVIKPLRSLRNYSRLLLKHPHILYTAAAPWTVQTYGRIYDWLKNVEAKKPVYTDREKPWMTVVVELSAANDRLHPFVIESVLSQWVPGVEVLLVTPKGYRSETADYYTSTHSYVRVVQSSNINSLVKSNQKVSVIMRDDQILPPDSIRKHTKARSKRGAFQRRQVVRQPEAPVLGGFQSPEAAYRRNISYAMRGYRPKQPKRRLKILTYRWHCGHQYELYKLPHDFHLVEDRTTMDWDYSSRPFPANAKLVPFDEVDQRDYDLAILHFDENCVNPAISNGVLTKEWGAIFRRVLAEITEIPRIGICHGTPPFHGMFNVDYRGSNLMHEWAEEKNKILAAVGNMPVVCNSWHAWEQWGFPQSRVIWQGFDANEYSIGPRKKGAIYVANAIRYRPWYRGYHEFKHLCQHFPIDYLGRDDLKEFRGVIVPEPRHRDKNLYAKMKFKTYTDFLGRYSIFVNTTLRSPMPRSRAEAMLKGAVCVTMDYHDESMFIETGVNGFTGRTKEELESHLRWVYKNPDAAKRIGLRGRETIRRIFPLSRYHREWQENFVDLLGGDS